MKTAEDIFEYLKRNFPESDVSFEPERKVQPWVTVPPEAITEISRFLRDDPELRFNTLMCLSGVHYPDEEMFGVTYHLHSTPNNISLILKVSVPESRPRLPSVESVWKTANWHEREAYDMFGIVFENHPDLRRILCPDDWEGHPLRKDYKQAEFYRDIKISYGQPTE